MAKKQKKWAGSRTPVRAEAEPPGLPPEPPEPRRVRKARR